MRTEQVATRELEACGAAQLSPRDAGVLEKLGREVAELLVDALALEPSREEVLRLLQHLHAGKRLVPVVRATPRSDRQ